MSSSGLFFHHSALAANVTFFCLSLSTALLSSLFLYSLSMDVSIPSSSWTIRIFLAFSSAIGTIPRYSSFSKISCSLFALLVPPSYLCLVYCRVLVYFPWVFTRRWIDHLSWSLFHIFLFLPVYNQIVYSIHWIWICWLFL